MGPIAPFQLELVTTFGWSDFDRSVRLTEREQRAGAAILGQISDLSVAQDPTELYVLDPTGFKVVVFDTTGAYRRLILGGSGEGPGEFRRPTSLTRVGPDRFGVLDARLRRISMFRREGGFLRSTQVATSFPLQILGHGESLYVVKLVIGDGALVMELDSTGAQRDSTFMVEGRLADFVEFGEPGRLAIDSQGRPLLTYPAPGLWAHLAVGQPVVSHGQDLYPDVRGGIETVGGREVRGVRLGVRGFAELSDGTKIIHAFHFVRQPGTPPTSQFFNWLFFFDPEGAFLGHLTLPTGHRGPTIAGFSGSDILIGSDDPYPRVLRYRVRSTAR